jgi:hypothetical protein
MSGNGIGVCMQDPDRDFTTIKAQIDGIMEKYYGICAT